MRLVLAESRRFTGGRHLVCENDGESESVGGGYVVGWLGDRESKWLHS